MLFRATQIVNPGCVTKKTRVLKTQSRNPKEALSKSVDRAPYTNDLIEPMPLVTKKRYEVVKKVAIQARDFYDSKSMELLEKALVDRYN